MNTTEKKEWLIVTDSTCDLKFDTTSPVISHVSVPFTVTIDGKDYIDNDELNLEEMITAMEDSGLPSGSGCPSPYTYEQEFLKADKVIAVTISSNLSGSFNSAQIAKENVLEQFPEKQIAVIDSLSAGPEIPLVLKYIFDLLENNCDFDEVVAQAQQYLNDAKVIFALSSFDNFVKNGRMSKITGFVAKKLGMWGIGIGSEQGTVSIKGKTRGPKKALDIIIEDMVERGFRGKSVAISHCQNEQMTNEIIEKIKQTWPNTEFTVLTTGGLNSYYAERGGLLLAFY